MPFLDCNKDFAQTRLSPETLLVQHPAATFYHRVTCANMTRAGIHPGDLLVIDCSLKPSNGSIVLMLHYGRLIVRKLRITRNVGWFYAADSPGSKQLLSEDDCLIRGVVTFAIRAVHVK